VITKKIIFYSILFALVIGQPLFSQKTDTGAPENQIDEKTLTVDTTNAQSPVLNQANSTFSVWDGIRMVLVLGGVLGVIYLFFFLLKKAGRPVKDSGSIINVIATKNLTNNSAVHILKVGNQYFFVGAGDGNIRLLSEITDRETLDQFKLESSGPLSQNRSFSDILKGVFRGSGGLGNVDKERSGFLKQQRERLKKM